ncbi:MAG: hypothetical protein EXR51_11465 [Dehalococcoidia bacterium]|nr:hypothetical protein [Dehalococcoidia bacterium]
MALASLAPVLAAWYLTPAGFVFTGLLMNPLDNAGYLAEMRSSAAGAWLLSVPYIVEPHPRVLIHPQYVLLGKIAGVFGIPLPVVFHGARALFGLLLLLTASSFFAAATPNRLIRRDAFLLLATGGGLSWATSMFGFLGSDATIPESLTFAGMLGNPHFPLATALFMAAPLATLRTFPAFSWRQSICASACNIALAAIQPFLLVSQGVIFACWALVMMRLGHSWRQFLRPAIALIFLAPLPVALYLGLQLYGEPVLSQWMAQNASYSPPPWVYLSGYGPPAVLAIMGGLALLRAPGQWLTAPGGRFATAWLVAGAALLYALGPWERRLSEGYHLPIALLAATGLHAFFQPRLSQRTFRWTLGTVAGLGVLGNLWFAAVMVLGALDVKGPHYVTKADALALEWLAGANGDDVVLSSPSLGTLIPVWSDAKPYWGHPVETIDAERKRAEVVAFYGGGVEERCRLLQRSGATLVYAGPVERNMGGADLGRQPGLSTAYETSEVTIFRVTGCAGSTAGHS